MRLDQLTFTRYVAALAVVFFHYGSTVFPANLTWLNPILTAGPIAVSYFYVLSGFIMAVVYYSADTRKPFRHWRYWLARFARIYPVYLLALLLMIAAKHKTAGSDPLTVFLSLGMLQAWIPGYPLTLNAPGWSLSVEAFFYLCFPLLLLIAHRLPLKTMAIGAGIIWLLTQITHTFLFNSAEYGTPFSHLHDFIFYNPLMHLNTFILGLITGMAFRQGRLSKLSDAPLNQAGLLLSSCAILLLLVLRKPLIHSTQIAFDYTNGLIAPLFAIFIVLLALNQGMIRRFLEHPWMILLGEASFSLYILQKPAHGIYEKVLPAWISPGSALHFYLFVTTLTLLAILSYKFFESPLRHFINSFYTSSDKSG